MKFRLPHQAQKAIDFISGNEKDLICTIKKQEKSRSVQQLRYYWYILTMLQNDTGMDKEDFHIYFRSKFLQTSKEINGEIIEYTMSTGELSTILFEHYLAKIRMFASVELGIFLPLPNETIYDYLKL